VGEVPPDPVLLGRAIAEDAHPAGLTAANALGLTRQVPARLELAVADRRLTAPQGVEFKLRLGVERGSLLPAEAALLEVLRDLKHLSDLSPEETLDRLLVIVRRRDSRKRLIRAALHEPPRVRAMVGALAEHAGATPKDLARLRRSLNPTTRYDFGALRILPRARDWGAR
jgi:hypothetical protein